jgi:hypothetical protein
MLLGYFVRTFSGTVSVHAFDYKQPDRMRKIALRNLQMYSVMPENSYVLSRSTNTEHICNGCITEAVSSVHVQSGRPARSTSLGHVTQDPQ